MSGSRKRATSILLASAGRLTIIIIPIRCRYLSIFLLSCPNSSDGRMHCLVCSVWLVYMSLPRAALLVHYIVNFVTQCSLSHTLYCVRRRDPASLRMRKYYVGRCSSLVPRRQDGSASHYNSPVSGDWCCSRCSSIHSVQVSKGDPLSCL